METISNEKSFIKEVIIAAPLDLVWHAWTISNRVSKWFAPKTIVEPKIGGAFELYFEPDNTNGMNTRGCKIKKIVSRKELVFTWKGPDQFAPLMNNVNDLTVVKVTLEDQGKQTKVMVKHGGWKDGEDWEEAIKWHEMAWQGVLKSLKTALENGEGELCCQPK